MNKTSTTVAAFAAACFAGTAFAGPAPAPAPSKRVVETLEESCITGNIGLDVTSNYISKGVMWVNQGAILSPYADLSFRFAKNVGFIDSASVDLGFQSVYSDNARNLAGPGALAAGTGNWLEFNFTAGLTLEIDKLSVSPYYKIYQSPSNFFQNTYTTGIRLAYDDSDLLGAWALHPYALVELQLQNSRGNNFPAVAPLGFNGRGQYYEVGITPSHSYGDLTLSLPIKAGFGSGGFYLGNRGFGFFSVGLSADYALNFVPACLGKWTLQSNVSYVRLGGSNTPVPGSFGLGTGAGGLAPAFFPGAVVNDLNQVVFTGGLHVAF